MSFSNIFGLEIVDDFDAHEIVDTQELTELSPVTLSLLDDDVNNEREELVSTITHHGLLEDDVNNEREVLVSTITHPASPSMISGGVLFQNEEETDSVESQSASLAASRGSSPLFDEGSTTESFSFDEIIRDRDRRADNDDRVNDRLNELERVAARLMGIVQQYQEQQQNHVQLVIVQQQNQEPQQQPEEPQEQHQEPQQQYERPANEIQISGGNCGHCCPVCWDSYDSNKTFKALPCGHIVCEICIPGISNHMNLVVCPMCYNVAPPTVALTIYMSSRQ